MAGWLRQDAEPASAEPAPTPAPALFWVPREPEPELQAIPFAGDDSSPRHSTIPSTVRADEAPTQQIPLSAEYASLSRGPIADADRDTDKTPKPAPAAAAAVSDAPADAPVPREIEMLAQRSSIPELTQMLSSVRSVDMTDEQIERLATRVVEKLSDRIVREIAWEVIPDMAEIVIKQRIKELEAGAE